MKYLRAAAVLALLAATLLPAPAWADYIDSNGNIVHWAGGNNIVVTDQNGNTVYSGAGVSRSDGRLVVPGSTGAAPAYDPNTAGPLGLRGETPPPTSVDSAGPGNQGGPSPLSPYAGTTYANMQPVSLTVGGQTLSGYANVYRDANGGGYSAVPVTSDIGKLLAQNGFQVRDGTVLIHNGAAGATVGWTADPTKGPNANNVSTLNYVWSAGGTITINVSSSGVMSSYSPPTSTSYAPSYGSDTRKLAAYPEQPVVTVGKPAPLVAEVTGNASQVQAFTAWGGSAILKKQSDGRFRGLLQVPVNVRPGAYPLTFEAGISQSGYAESLFSVTGMLTVRALADTGTTGGKAPADEPDWWTPPWLQGR